MRISARHVVSLLFLLITLLAAVWGIQRVGSGERIGQVLVAAEADVEARILHGLTVDSSLICAYDPNAAFGAILTPGDIRDWRSATFGPYGTLDQPLATLWTLFCVVGLAGIGHALAIGGLSLLNPNFVAIAWWALLPEMFLADGGWFGLLSPARLWPMLGAIGVVTRLRPWGRRSSACVPAAPARRRVLTRKTMVAGGVCWLTAFGVFAAVYPNLESNRANADTAAASSSTVRQERGQGEHVAENMGSDGGGFDDAGSETAPELAGAPPPHAPTSTPADGEDGETETASADSGPALPGFAGPSPAAPVGSTPGQNGPSQPTTAPSTPTTELALAESSPMMPPLSSPWMQMQLSDVNDTPPSAPPAGSEPEPQPQDKGPADHEPDVSVPEVPLPPTDAKSPLDDLPNDPRNPPGDTPGPKPEPDPTVQPAGPNPPFPPEETGEEASGPTIRVPEPGTLGLFALGLIGLARLRRRG